MKRLFVVTHSNKKLIKQAGIDRPFASKAEAKAARDLAGGTDKGFHVSYGPDHWRTK